VFQNVLTSKNLSVDDVCKKLANKMATLGDKVENNKKFGSKNTIDAFLFLKLKRLKFLLDTFDDNTNKHCLDIKNKQDLLNKISKVIN